MKTMHWRCSSNFLSFSVTALQMLDCNVMRQCM